MTAAMAGAVARGVPQRDVRMTTRTRFQPPHRPRVQGRRYLFLSLAVRHFPAAKRLGRTSLGRRTRQQPASWCEGSSDYEPVALDRRGTRSFPSPRSGVTRMEKGRHYQRDRLPPEPSAAQGSDGLHQEPEHLLRVHLRHLLRSRRMPTRARMGTSCSGTTLEQSELGSIATPVFGWGKGFHQSGAVIARNTQGSGAWRLGISLAQENHGTPAQEIGNLFPREIIEGLPQEEGRATMGD